jgi:hypothetical protein
MTATVMVATHRPEYSRPLVASLSEVNHVVVDGTGFPSCSHLWNRCIERCPTELVVIANERSRPLQIHIDKLLGLLDQGYALVGLYRFGFFGFPKETIRIIGPFDERFVGGWYEDNDAILRLRESDLAYFESEECPYLFSPSSWPHEKASEHFRRKWNRNWTRSLPEPASTIDLGSNTGQTFLPWSKSVLMEKSGGQYK